MSADPTSAHAHAGHIQGMPPKKKKWVKEVSVGWELEGAGVAKQKKHLSQRTRPRMYKWNPSACPACRTASSSVSRAGSSCARVPHPSMLMPVHQCAHAGTPMPVHPHQYFRAGTPIHQYVHASTPCAQVDMPIAIRQRAHASVFMPVC
jgi:hypothetical protein